MTRTQLVSLLFLVTNLMTVLAYKYVPVDYCNFDHCKKHHIACNYQGIGKSCPPDVKYIPLGWLKHLILIMHNGERSELASAEKGLKPASKMATMQWDDELSEFALMYAFKCNLTVELCHNTKKFKYSGQNTAGMYYEDGKITPQTLQNFVVDRVNHWFKEATKVTDKHLAAYPESNTDPLIGHYTLAMNELSTHIGCAVTSYTINKKNALTLICNYATNNMVGRRTYTVGYPGEDCATYNNEYNFLCGLDDKYDYESHIKTE